MCQTVKPPPPSGRYIKSDDHDQHGDAVLLGHALPLYITESSGVPCCSAPAAEDLCDASSLSGVLHFLSV